MLTRAPNAVLFEPLPTLIKMKNDEKSTNPDLIGDLSLLAFIIAGGYFLLFVSGLF